MQTDSSRSRRTRLATVLAVLGLVLAGLSGMTPAHATPPVTSALVGAWRVVPAGAHRYEVSWRSPTRLPVGSDRPRIVAGSGARESVARLDGDGRTVRATVQATRTPATADLHVLPSGDRLDLAGRDGVRTGARAAANPTPAPARDLVADPARFGPYRVTTSDYVRPSVSYPGFAERIEMVGHVVEPAPGQGTARRPLIVFQHGRHGVCYQVRPGDPDDSWPCRGTMAEIPSHLGYDYLQRLLASQGFVTVSIRVNGINAQDYLLSDGGADARALIIRRHLDYWATVATAHQVDLSRVVLVGHSRGGEGVDRASIQIPLTAPYRVVGQVLIAPTDFAEQTAAYVPTVTLLPYCDGDVSDLQGQHYTDIARDAASDDTALHSSVLIMGANHNYFNSEWTPGSVAPSSDDWGGDERAACGARSPDRLSPARQRSAGSVYVAAAVRLFTRDQQQFLPLLDGSAATTTSLGRTLAYSHAVGAGRDVRRPGSELRAGLPDGARTDLCRGFLTEDFRPDTCGSDLGDLISPHWYPAETPAPARSFWRMRWTAAGQTGSMLLDRPLDLRGRRLDLRTLVDPRTGAVDLRVRLTDLDGATVTLDPVGGDTIRPLPTLEFGTKLWGQVIRVDPTGAGIDLSRVGRIDLIGNSPDGTVYVADVAAHTDRAAAVPGLRLPRLDVGSARVVEGDRTGWTVALVPWTLSEPAARSARFTVSTVNPDGVSNRYDVSVPVGQRSGVVEVGYQADDLDDLSPAVTEVTVWPGTNLMTDRYVGRLSVVDDDPTPALTLTATPGRIAEGATARWQVRLADPVDYEVSATASVVTGPGAEATGLDVSADWFDSHCPGDRRQTLAAAGCQVDLLIPRGELTGSYRIPTVRDRVEEGTETITLRSVILGRTYRSQVQLANRN